MSIPLKDQAAIRCRQLLSELNREPTSSAYGCFDRRYWAWKLTDFPEATFQRNLAALRWYFRQSQAEFQPADAMEILRSGLEFTFKIQHRDGSFDQAFPNEHSFGATGFLLPDLITAYQAIKQDCCEVDRLLFESGLRHAADFLARHSEQHGLISNHLAGAALGLIKASAFFDEKRYVEKARNLLDFILGKQTGEGWFPEYGGADPGYQTLCMHYLAQIYKLEPSKALKEALQRSLAFLKYFAHPDGTFGGEYGSRRTEIYYPGGIALLAGEFQDASSLHHFMLPSIEAGNTVTLADVDMGNTAPLLTSTIIAAEYKTSKNKASALPFQQPLVNQEFPQAGIALRSRQKYYLVLGASNGGVVKVFKKRSGNLVLDDCGILGLDENNRKLTTQATRLDNSMQTNENSLACESDFYALTNTLPNPFNYLVLRILNLTLMRIGFLNEAIKKLMVGLLVKNSSRIAMSRKREITLDPQAIEITDTILNPGKMRLKLLTQGFKFTAIHMASAHYFTPSQAAPPQAQVLDHAALTSAGSLQVKKVISFEKPALKSKP